MADRNDSNYKIHRRIDKIWKESQSAWALKSIDHYDWPRQNRKTPVPAE